MPEYSEPQEKPKRRSKRKLGPPLGNQNAVTHGLYATVLKNYGPEGISRRVVNNLKGEIVLLKDLAYRLYEQGLTLKDPLETATVVRAIALAALAMTRLLDKHEELKPPSPAFVKWKKESDPTYSLEDHPFPGTYDENDPNPPGDKIELGLAKANAFMDALDRKMKAAKKLPKADIEDAEDPIEDDHYDDQPS